MVPLEPAGVFDEMCEQVAHDLLRDPLARASTGSTLRYGSCEGENQPVDRLLALEHVVYTVDVLAHIS